MHCHTNLPSLVMQQIQKLSEKILSSNFRFLHLFRYKILFFFSFFYLLPFPCFAKASSSSRHLYLTWENDPHNSVTINVHNLSSDPNLYIFYDLKSQGGKVWKYRHRVLSKGKKSLPLPDGRFLHHVELKNLAPNTTYYFVVGNKKGGYSEEKIFTSLPVDSDYFHFVQGGDWELTPLSCDIAKRAAAQNPMAVLLGGDYPSWAHHLSDYKKWDEWLDQYSRIMVRKDQSMIPMVLAIGNHEVEGGFSQDPEKAPFFLHYFQQNPERKTYFSRLFGKDIVLFVLDSGHVASHHGEQLQWLEQEMKRYKNLPVKLAMYHVPLYPSVRFATKDLIYHAFYQFFTLQNKNDIAQKLLSPYSGEGKTYWLPLFDKYQLTAAFEHHDQALKRTFPLRYDQIHPMGTCYLGDGGWGCELQYPPLQSYLYPHFACTKGQVHFFWDIKIRKDSIHYTALSASGEIYDQYIQPISR